MLANVDRERLKSFLNSRSPSNSDGADFRAIVLPARGNILKICDLCSHEKLFVKQSRWSAQIVTAQMDAVNELARRNPSLLVPDCFALFTDAGLAYEVWEWIQREHSENSPCPLIDTRGYLARFVAATTAMGWTRDFDWPNKSLDVFLQLEEAQLRTQLRWSKEIPAACRLLLTGAENIASNNEFNSAALALPVVLVHSDIRLSNFVNNRLVDFSNSRPDWRLLEISRFLLLNLDTESDFVEVLNDPNSILLRNQIRLTNTELRLFVKVVALDFSNLYLWAHRQVARGGQDEIYALPFLIRCEKQAPWICDALELRCASS